MCCIQELYYEETKTQGLIDKNCFFVCSWPACQFSKLSVFDKHCAGFNSGVSQYKSEADLTVANGACFAFHVTFSKVCYYLDSVCH